MLGDLYTVLCDGEEYCGNVRLREHHRVVHDGRVFVLDVEAMTTREITPDLSRLIDAVASPMADLVPARWVRELVRTGLVDDPEGGVPTGPAAEAARPGALPSVTNLSLLVAQTCDLACVYCYGRQGSYGEEGLMSEETARQAVDWLLDSSAGAPRITVSFFGGEPLHNFPVVTSVTHHCRELASRRGQDVSFSLTTSCTVLTEPMLEFLAREEIEVLVSLDGPGRVHDAQRPFKDGRGSHEVVSANVRRLVAACGRRVSARATLMDPTDPDEVVRAVRELGIEDVLVSEVSPVLLAPARPGPDGAAAPAGDCPRVVSFHQARLEQLHEQIRSRSLDRLPQQVGLLDALISRRKRHYACGAGKVMAGVSATGRLYPCHRFVGCAGACQGTLADHRAGRPDEYWRAVVLHLEPCSTCWARYLCGGGCPYENEAFTGCRHSPAPVRCESVRAQCETAIRIVCQLDAGDREYLASVFAALERGRHARDRAAPPPPDGVLTSAVTRGGPDA